MTVGVFNRLSVDFADALEAEGCSISLLGRSVGASAVVFSDLEDWQVVVGRGPSLAAAGHGEPEEYCDLDEIHAAYPEFSPYVAQAGMRALRATPICLDGVPLGAVTAYHATAQSRSIERCARAAACAASAVPPILSFPWADAQPSTDEGSCFACATGVVMGALAVSHEEAALRIRARAWSSDVPLRILCLRIIDRRDFR